MKFLAVMGLLLATQAGAQATSQQRIPIKKQRAAARVDTVVIRLVDTVVVKDTVYLPAAAPLTTTLPLDSLVAPDTSCGRSAVPIPVPIPIPIDHNTPASTIPEPGTLWLTGIGLVAVGFVWGRRHRERDSV